MRQNQKCQEILSLMEMKVEALNKCLSISLPKRVDLTAKKEERQIICQI